MAIFNFAIKPPDHFIIMNRSHADAFTLMELMVVIAIFSILAAIGIFSATNYLPIYQKKAAGRTIISDLVKAKIHAIRQRTPQTFIIVNNREYLIRNSNNISDVFLTRDFIEDFGWKGITIQSDTNPIFNIDGTINNISTINIHGADSDPLSITMTITGNLSVVE